MQQQQVAKSRWKRTTPYGISASQFGMALGYCGCVSDYVDYLRNIVGTAQEFCGNACTEHGIRTEPKARALYELLTGQKVHDGGFFLTEDKLLGCSPDGRVFYWESEEVTPEGDSLERSQPGKEAVNLCSQEDAPRGFSSLNDASWSKPGSVSTRTVSIPSPGDAARGGRARVFLRRRLRLLEIKSPFRALYSGGRADAAPFGIPHRYLCQVQGQMAIAGAETCDFFVFLDSPAGREVVGWRVRRSPAFWAWAAPKLRAVAAWVRDGPPPGLDRRFRFPSFDLARVEVAPLVFPFALSAGAPLVDPVRFGFFSRFPPPCMEGGASGRPAGLREVDQIAAMVAHPVTKFLFDGPEEGEGESVDPQYCSSSNLDFFIEDCSSIDHRLNKASLASTDCSLSRRRAQTFTLPFEDKKRLEDAIAATSFGSLALNPLEKLLLRFTVSNIANPPRDSAPMVRLLSPDDWERGEVVMEVLNSANDVIPMVLRFSDRCFFELLRLPEPFVKGREVTEVHAVGPLKALNGLTAECIDFKCLHSTNRATSCTRTSSSWGSPPAESVDERVYYCISSDESILDS